ncbi:DNA replication ATP-dependent helicase/nuclease Dna2 [Marchantia polymorpha subsp. ruderalis]|uniref:DNA replication ATP-dependent helicase/nuclease n=2 Tax=Marchantia polymorpha TaxID=3197 RepID=A0AAF6B1K7_MARPO|nr:hypothetical protein MARPO_0039s0120 [Marchantia polymorpha]BBN05891.1 hypothetical protein Mp_3g16750 [Marchantia polymorpha subsp. ruderalis]|eukprot:PTQ40634.1 hypothetical protein MARPO_0039s0120 [Marchantia polymorpha]
MARQAAGTKAEKRMNGELPGTGAGPDRLGKSLKKLPKRRSPVQPVSNVPQSIMPSQDDGGDEIVWKFSPTAARLQAATVGGSEPTLTGQRRKALQPCTNSVTKSDAAHGIWSAASIQGTSNTKKKKSPGMAGKLELWLRSTQKGPTKPILEKNVDLIDEEKENVQIPENSPTNLDVQQGLTPRYEKKSISVQQRPSTSSQRRPLSAKKAGSTSLPTVTAKRRKLLELLDRVDSEIKRTPTSITLTRNSDLPVNEKQISPERTKVSLDLSQVKRRQFNITDYLASQASGEKCLANDSPAATFVKNEEKVVHTSVQIVENNEGVCTKLSSTNDDNLQLPHVVENLTALDIDNNSASSVYEDDHLDPPLHHNEKERSIHFLVLEVSEGEYKSDSNLTYPQKTLRLLDENCGLERFACLRDSWSYSDVAPGDTVNVLGDFDEANNCVIDREHNLLIINPDILISGSKVGSSFACPRRAVLDERMKTNEWSYAALIGTMLHQLFQGALRSRQPLPADLESEAELIVQRNLDGLYAAGVSEREALSKLVEAIPTILKWWQQHVRAEEKTREFEPLTRGKHVGSISEILDIEEMIWSPKYGLKGMIDASVTVKLGNLTLGGEDRIMPLEFKTGKATTGQAGVEHRAQVILYTLLMSDRYMQTVNTGLLYYLHTNQTQEVAVQQGELVGLIMRRNEHARDLLKASASQTLPPLLQSSQMCQNCRQLDSCAVYHKAQDGVTADSNRLGEVFDKSTTHLTTADLEFFQQWDRLIDLEFRDLLMSHSEIWRMPSKKREELGRCMSSLVLSTSPNNSDDRKESAGYFLYTFRRASSTSDHSSTGDMCTPSSSLRDRPFHCGDYVVLSTESGHTAVAGGIVASLNEVSIVIRLSHRLHNPKRSEMSAKARTSQELWRIDKDESASIMATMRFNLLQLFVKNNGDEQRRRLIVGLEAPKFECGPNDDTDPGLKYVRSAIDLNEDQRHAINRILSAKDYTLILGMPGTGKTSTIVHTVIALMRRNLSVLLTSYTNSAVDNILLKLRTLGIDFTRIGRSSAVHPELRDKVLGEGKSYTTVEEFASAVDCAQVVGVTCLGISHALFSKRKFDVCIVDEAGQITLPICLGPLRCARRFVLVGDHYQLPPLVRTQEAREDGMAVSLFRRLSEAHPQSSCALQSQYRMCSDIMALSNSLIYGDRLRCGSPQVANATLQLSSTPVSSAWLSQVVNPEQRVLFLDTDKLSTEESRVRHKVYNSTEASLLLKVVHVFHEGGLALEKIGVISPYNAQVDYIQQLATKSGFSDLEVHTVDKYQGRDKDCVLISFVRSNPQRQSGQLLADWHRINVAITRAKTKLVLLGSKKTLSSAPILKLLIEKVDRIGGLLELPANALSGPC